MRGELEGRPAALVVGQDPVAGVGEPHRAVGGDHDVVGGVERFAVDAVGEHGDRAVVLGPGHPPGEVLAGDEPALPVPGVAVGVVGGAAEHRDRPGLLVPAQHPVAGDVAPEQAAVVAEPDRPLDPAVAGGDPLHGRVVQPAVLEPRVEDPDGGIGIAAGRVGPAIRRQRRILHVLTSARPERACSHTTTQGGSMAGQPSQIAVVTGAGSGIGAAVALALAGEGVGGGPGRPPRPRAGVGGRAGGRPDRGARSGPDRRHRRGVGAGPVRRRRPPASPR